MSDVYVYHFMVSNDGDGEISLRPATPGAIRGLGMQPLMESQIVVDHTQLDADGFLVGRAGSSPYDGNDIAAQIWTLEVRAASRDKEADDSLDGVEKYMLSLESRELRKQARILKMRRPVPAAGQSDAAAEAPVLVHFGAGLAID